MTNLAKDQIVKAFPARVGCSGMISPNDYLVKGIGPKFVTLVSQNHKETLRLSFSRPVDPDNGMSSFDAALKVENAERLWLLCPNGGIPYICGYYVMLPGAPEPAIVKEVQKAYDKYEADRKVTAYPAAMNVWKATIAKIEQDFAA